MRLNPDALIDGAVARHTNDWSGHDRSSTSGGSEIGACARKQVYEKCGQQRDANFRQDYGALERGHMVERWTVEQLQAELKAGRDAGTHDIELLFSGLDQQTLVRGAQSITPDGLFFSPSGMIEVEDPDTKAIFKVREVYLELKSKDPRPFDRLVKAEFGHTQQTMQGMDLMTEVTKYSPSFGVIMYVNASFVSQRKSFWVKRSEANVRALRERARKIHYEYSLTNLPQPEGVMYGGHDCEYCPFREACDKHELGRVPDKGVKSETPPNLDAQLKDLVERRALARELEQMAEQDRKQMEQEIAQVLLGAKVGNYRGPDFTVSVWTQAPPPQLDYEAMQADGIDPKKYTKKGEPGIRIGVRFNNKSAMA